MGCSPNCFDCVCSDFLLLYLTTHNAKVDLTERRRMEEQGRKLWASCSGGEHRHGVPGPHNWKSGF